MVFGYHHPQLTICKLVTNISSTHTASHKLNRLYSVADTICSNSDAADNIVGSLKAIKKRPYSAPSTQELAQQVERLGKRQKTSFAYLTHARSYPYNAQPFPPH